MSKRCKEIEKIIEKKEIYTMKEALEFLKKCPKVKFDETVEISLKLGVDPKKADQQVRGTVLLPHGRGKKIKVLVFAKGDKASEAKDAGADFVGDAELVEKVKGGWIDFDVVIATPEMMREVGKLGKILGPRGLMPSPKIGTVTADVKKAVEEAKIGRIEFKVDKQGIINVGIGKLSFTIEALLENIETCIKAIARAKPSSAKGIYMQDLYIASTMGPGLKVEIIS